MTARRDSEQGVALILVLWVVALLAILVAGLLYQTHAEAQIARNRYDHIRAGALADAGVSLAILGLFDRGSNLSRRLDGSVTELAFDGGTIRLRMQDEAGKLDLNYTPPQILAALFRLVADNDDDTADLADAIAAWKRRRLAQWRDSENRLSNATGGPFLAVEELREVPGITREAYRSAAPFVTVLSQRPRVDPLSAPREVLLSLPGADPRAIDAYVEARADHDPGTMPALPGISPYLGRDGAGEYVSILSEGSASPSGRFVREATVSLLAAGDQSFRFVSWREGEGVRD